MCSKAGCTSSGTQTVQRIPQGSLQRCEPAPPTGVPPPPTAACSLLPIHSLVSWTQGGMKHSTYHAARQASSHTAQQPSLTCVSHHVHKHGGRIRVAQVLRRVEVLLSHPQHLCDRRAMGNMQWSRCEKQRHSCTVFQVLLSQAQHLRGSGSPGFSWLSSGGSLGLLWAAARARRTRRAMLAGL